MRVGGKFVDSDGNKSEGQHVSELSPRVLPQPVALIDLTCV
jgi:hypothetical protein